MIWLLSLLACSTENPDVDAVPEDFYGVDHRITTQSVDDRCFDGAMSALFMPEGSDTPQRFEYPVYIPAIEELPKTYEISLREPFVGMEITAEDGGDGIIQIVGGRMESVALGTTFGSCVATMDVIAQILPTGDSFSFSTIITMSNLRGDEERCPVPQAEPCTVGLSMSSVPD